MSDNFAFWVVATILIFTSFFASIGVALLAEDTQASRFDATLVRNDIGSALTCWTITGDDIYCQEIITP